jgi:hypothetical protein
MKLLTWFLAAGGLWAAGPDVQEIVKRSLEKEVGNLRRLNDYTWEEKEIQQTLDKKGQVKKTETKVYEQLVIDGSRFRRLLEEDGKPLPESKARKEQERVDKEIAKFRNQSEGERRKRLEEERKMREEIVKARSEVLKAFDFTLVGEEKANNFNCWRVEAKPRSGYVPQYRQAKVFPKIQGTIWIDQKTYEWVKIEAETIDKLTFGGFLAALQKGARFQMQQMRVADELWHPEWFKVRLDARALVKSFNLQLEQSYRNFRKFQTDSKIVGVEEVRD